MKGGISQGGVRRAEVGCGYEAEELDEADEAKKADKAPKVVS